MVPLVASQFVEDWHWGVGGFVRVYVLFFPTGMAYALIARRMGAWSYKAGVGLALVAGLPWGGRRWSRSRTRDIRSACGTTVCSWWEHWGVPGSAEGAGAGRDVVRDGGDARADRRDAAFGRAARHGAEYGHRAWCLRGVVHRVRSDVPAREFGGIEVRPICNRPPVRPAPGCNDLLLFLPFAFIFCVFSPKIACQVPKPPNRLKPRVFRLAY